MPLFVAFKSFLALKARNRLAGSLDLCKGLRGRTSPGLHGHPLGQRQQFPRIVELLLLDGGQGVSFIRGRPDGGRGDLRSHFATLNVSQQHFLDEVRPSSGGGR